MDTKISIEEDIKKINHVITEVAILLVKKGAVNESDAIADAINKAGLMVIQYGCSNVLEGHYSLQKILDQGSWLNG